MVADSEALFMEASGLVDATPSRYFISSFFRLVVVYKSVKHESLYSGVERLSCSMLVTRCAFPAPYQSSVPNLIKIAGHPRNATTTKESARTRIRADRAAMTSRLMASHCRINSESITKGSPWEIGQSELSPSLNHRKYSPLLYRLASLNEELFESAASSADCNYTL